MEKWLYNCTILDDYHLLGDDNHHSHRRGNLKSYIVPFLTSALDGGEWSASCYCHFTPCKIFPSIHWIGGWAGPRAGLDPVEKRINLLSLLRIESRPSSP
jgi:hypothetical protein